MPSSRPRPARARAQSRAQAVTLIEVVAGLVILATVLASVTIARGRMMRQWADADRKLAAVRAADVMIAQWIADSDLTPPTNASGAVAGVEDCVWRTQVRRDRSAAELGALIVRLEIFDRRVPAARPPLVAVEFLVREPPRLPATKPIENGGEFGDFRR